MNAAVSYHSRPIRRLLCFVLWAGILLPSTSADDRVDLWQHAEDAIEQGLPRTAIEHLEPLIETALAAEAWGEAARAITLKVALEGDIEGNRAEERIQRLERKIASAPPPMQPLLQTVQAYWYWHFFRQNRWRFIQRTATAEPPSDDILSWDLPRIFAEIDTHFQAALAASDTLQRIPIDDFDDFLDAGTLPDRYRPTLYDFVAASALEFYTSGEQAAAHPQDAFVLRADSPVLGPREDFMGWEVETTDTESPVYRAVRLYQDVLRFHAATGDSQLDALFDWDLERLRFGFNLALGEEKNARYKAALRRFVERSGDHEAAARACSDWAQLLMDEGNPGAAHTIARRGSQIQPDSIGARLCRFLIEDIEAPRVSISTERVWTGTDPRIDVSYRNLTNVYFRLYRKDFVGRMEHGREGWNPEQLTPPELRRVLTSPPDAQWAEPLPATPDFMQREESLSVPNNLKPGFYVLLSSHDAEFSDRHNVVNATPVWVSDLALIIRSMSGDPRVETLLMDADSGEPIPEATVRLWRHNFNTRPQPVSSLTTDADGLIEFEATPRFQYLLLAEHGNQALAASTAISHHRWHDRSRQREQVIFFTDRAIYRPGQTIRFKGIALSVDEDANQYEVVEGRPIQIEFLDANGEPIETLDVRSNDYGSFSGSFTAPRDRLMGSMSIRAQRPQGNVSIRVEEYKRPTFQVELTPPEEAAKLWDTVTVGGSATAYTGAATDGADVRWRVVREVRWPPWWPWWRRGGIQSTPSQEIAHGVTRTDAAGRFEIEFHARPDESVSPEGNPSFRYTVFADVTDAAGETRSTRTVVNVGYVALELAFSTPGWIEAATNFTVTLRSTTLDGVGQSSVGTLRVHTLEQPDRVHRIALTRGHWRRGHHAADDSDLSTPANWPLGAMIQDEEIVTDATGHAENTLALAAGAYRLIWVSEDRFGQPVHAERDLIVQQPDAAQLDLPIPFSFAAPSWTVEPGETFTALWGSGYDSARAYVEVEHRGNILQRYWTDPDVTQEHIVADVTEEMRGGFTVRITMVRENRAYMEQRRVEVPWSNKNLELSWERFTSRLEPGQSEEWTLVIRGPDAERTAAELVATLYDQSLDSFVTHSWRSSLGVFRTERLRQRSSFQNQPAPLRHALGTWPSRLQPRASYRSFPDGIIQAMWGPSHMRRRIDSLSSPLAMQGLFSGRSEAPATEAAPQMAFADRDVRIDFEAAEEDRAEDMEAPPAVDLDQVQTRVNLEELAFFVPHAQTDENGEVRLSFTMPDALTQWRFLGFAHDPKLRSGLLTASTVTAKDLMVQPNPPRFLREGDELEFTVRVLNQSPTRQTGRVRLTFSDARTGDSVDAQLSHEDIEQPFDIPSQESRTYSWRLHVPDGMGYLVYRAVGASDELSDGEEAYLPVLSRRTFVMESLPLPIRGPDTRVFEFEKLLAAAQSDTLEHQQLIVQMVSNPAWYAVLALPYLMECPHASSEQVYSRLYANALARHIAQSDPRIRRIFDEWQGTEALDSPLERNADLNAIALEETPWVRQAANESQARRQVGILFDDNRLNDELQRTGQQLTDQQLSSGAWPWFPGGRPNRFITLHIATGLGRLRHLGVDADIAPALSAMSYLDQWMAERFEDIKPEHRHRNHLTSYIALYLYGRSFFLNDQPIAADHQEAFDYYVEQARDYWLRLASRLSQAHLAIALHRLGDSEHAHGIMNSIREHAVTDEELGMFWRDTERSHWWYRAPIETQAMMIEAFAEVMDDAEAVADCQVWLLKQKQTQNWRTTKATADAVYSLLLRGENLLASDVRVEVTLGDQRIEPHDEEAGTGFYERRFQGNEIKPEMGHVTVRKMDEGVSWGSLHWHYLEDMDRVTPHTATPLTLEKNLYTRVHTPRGPVLERVDGAIAVGDEVVVRIVLRTDRDMEFVHLQDHRPSGTEPVNVLSRYRFQDGLAYYESTRDTASHFFIDYLPKGTYVFEYPLRVQHRGMYETGIASVQCMYAPEFNSHSESVRLTVE